MEFLISPELAGERLDKLIVRQIPHMGRKQARQLFADGAVSVIDGDHRRPATKGDLAVSGTIIQINGPTPQAPRAATDAALSLKVVLETADVVVVDKVAGMPSAPLRADEMGCVANGLLARYPEMAGIGYHALEPGLCHRLDNNTSGLLLAARTAIAFEELSGAIRNGTLRKRYQLACWGEENLQEEGRITFPLAPHPRNPKRVYACRTEREVSRMRPRPAESRYRVLARRGQKALVEVSAPCAVRHQIRCHFSALGSPIVGDTLYDAPAEPGFERHALHAYLLGWAGQNIAPFEIISPPPSEILAIL